MGACVPHTPPDRIMQEIQLYPAPCLTKRVDWTINASMDLSKAFRKAEGRLSLNSVVTVCDSRPGIKAAITQTCCGSKQYDQSRKRETHTPQCKNSIAMHEQTFQNGTLTRFEAISTDMPQFYYLPLCYWNTVLYWCQCSQSAFEFLFE